MTAPMTAPAPTAPPTTAPCDRCGGPVTVPAGGGVVRCAHCGASLRARAGGGARWTERVDRLAGRVDRQAGLLRRRRDRAARRRARRSAAVSHTAVDWREVLNGLSAAAFGGLFLLGGLVVVAIAREAAGRSGAGAALVPLAGAAAFGSFGGFFAYQGLRAAWRARRVPVRADGRRADRPAPAPPTPPAPPTT